MVSDLSTQQINAWNNELASFGALAVQIWEFANSFTDEGEYLCGSRFTVVKLLYIWSRYIPLLGQIVNLALTHKAYEAPLERPCAGIFVYKTIVSQQSLNCLEIILLIRVYALYNQSCRVKYFLSTVFLVNWILQTSSNGLIIRALIERKSCIPETVTTSPVIIYCVSAFGFQGLILSMTIFKHIVGHHYGWARTPLTSLILREGIVACFFIFGMMVLNVAYENFGLNLGEAALAWYICLLSVTGCRLILDMRKLAISHTARRSEKITGLSLHRIWS